MALKGSERKNKQKKSTEILRYPNAEIYEDTDYLNIRIVEYVPVSKTGNGNKDTNFLIGRPGSRKNKNPKEVFATINLPVPSNIQDTNAVSYHDDKLNSLAAALTGAAEGLMKDVPAALSSGDFGKISPDVQSQIAKSGLSFDNARDLITKQLASSAASIFGGNVSINQILARQEGVIFNPNMELLFNGPTLRSFRFSFKMTPRDEKEMIQIKKIINIIKRNMAPQLTTSENLFLKTPNVFELSYKKGNGNHPFLHKFKQCFLENISVNYTGEGTYATYDDGTPVSMIMDLQFKELEPIYDMDYDDVKEGVGY